MYTRVTMSGAYAPLGEYIVNVLCVCLRVDTIFFFLFWETPLIDCTYELMATSIHPSIHLMFIPSLSLHAYNRDSCGYSRQPCDSVCGVRLLHDARVCAHGSRFSSSTTLVILRLSQSPAPVPRVQRALVRITRTECIRAMC